MRKWLFHEKPFHGKRFNVQSKNIKPLKPKINAER